MAFFIVGQGGLPAVEDLRQLGRKLIGTPHGPPGPWMPESGRRRIQDIYRNDVRLWENPATELVALLPGAGLSPFVVSSVFCCGT